MRHRSPCLAKGELSGNPASRPIPNPAVLPQSEIIVRILKIVESADGRSEVERIMGEAIFRERVEPGGGGGSSSVHVEESPQEKGVGTPDLRREAAHIAKEGMGEFV